MDARTIAVRPIGTIRTPFASPQGVPIQPRAAAGAEGIVDLRPEYAAGLRDLDGFERIWLIYWFDRAAAPRMTVRPYMDDAEHGLFATRAPARPNAIGMSCVRLLAIEGPTLRVADVDMLDGTPLLDIKPYAPQFDVFEVTRAGWLQDRAVQGRRADARFHRPNGDAQ